MRKVFSVVFVIQCLFAIAYGQNLVQLNVSVPAVNQIYAADLDIEHFKSSQILFIASLKSLVSIPVEVKLDVHVYVTLPDQPRFEIANAISTPLTLVPGEIKNITNVDLSGPDPPIHLERYHYDQTQFDKIKSVAMATGKMPAGIYEFVVTCLTPDGVPASNTYQSQIVVTNPGRLELRLPADGDVVPTPFPHFEWTADADTVILSVYEKLPYQTDPQDIVSGVPFLKMAVGGKSFNYPPGGEGVRPLAYGKTYYWYIEVPPSALRSSPQRSEIWSFTVSSSLTEGVQGKESTQSRGGIYTQDLVEFLNSFQRKDIADQISSVAGDVKFDGRTITLDEAVGILKKLEEKKNIKITVR
ncbi:MAG: hypothetical protein ACP5MI_10185 [Candidatus Kryptoniota bacterium]